MRWMLFFCLLALPVCFGCDKGRTDAQKRAEVGVKMAGAKAPATVDKVKEKEEFVALEGAPNAPVQPEKKERVEKPRRIRYTADLRVIVEDFDKAWEGLKAAMKEAKTEPAQEEINTSPGSPRSGTWKIRVPVDQLDAFRSAVIKLGDVERNGLQSEDMTAQYYDLEAHIANRNTEREAIRELLKEVGKKDLKHYIEVKRELDSITDDINRKEGQLRLWKNLTDLTTVTVNLREKQKFIPEERAKDREVPTFGMRASKSWSDSWDTFIGFCQGLAIIAIALVPWLPLPLGFVLFVWLIARNAFRKKPAPVVLEVVEDMPEVKEE